MKKRFIAVMAMFLMTGFSFAQSGASKPADENVAENFVSHTVTMGETVVMIARKYKITPQDVYEYNPDAVDGLTSNMRLKIPMHRTVDMTAPKTDAKYEVVSRPAAVAAAKPEKLHKQDAVAGTDMTASATPDVLVPESKAPKLQVEAKPPVTTPPAAPAPGSVSHVVKDGETLTEIAYKHNTSAEAVTKDNQEKLANGLVVGQTLTINPGRELFVTPLGIEETAEANTVMVTHHVVSGETLHGLCRKYKTTIADITEANQKALKHGLQAGQTLKIPSNSVKLGSTVGAVASIEPSIAETKATEAKVEAPKIIEPVVAKSGPSQEDTPVASENITPLVVVDTPAAGTSIADKVLVEHKVQTGETLTGLARKYHTTIEEITEANKKKLKKGLQAGQVINITSNTSGNIN